MNIHYNTIRFLGKLLTAFILITTNNYTAEANNNLTILQKAKTLINNKIQNKKIKDEAIHFVDSLLSLKNISEKTFLLTIQKTGNLFREQGNITSVIELYLETTSNYEQRISLTDQEEQTLMNLYIPLGASYEELGMWNRAIDFYLKALSISEKYKLENQKASIYNNIGAIYCNLNNYTKAEFYLENALQINKKTKNNKELFYNYNNLGSIATNRKEYEKALDYALSGIQLLNKTKDAYLYYFMQSNIGSLYILKEDYNLAISYLKNSMKQQLIHGFNSDLIQTYCMIAKVYDKLDKLDSVDFYLKKALFQTKQTNNKHLEGKILQNISTFYEHIGKINLAYNSLKQAIQINDSINIIDNQKKMTALENIYNADKKIKEKEIQIKDITLQKALSDRLWITMTFIIALLTLIILFLINRAKNIEKEKKIQLLITQQQKEIIKKEKELQINKEQELNHTIDLRNRELTTYTLHTIKTNEFISNINEELKQLILELNPRNKEQKLHLQQILKKLQQQTTTKDWEEFHFYFEQVHPSFYENLEKHYPDLTIKEKRLCAFLRLGLSSKDISAITFKEVRSVESARNRLRKKLELSAEENLTEFLIKNFS